MIEWRLVLTTTERARDLLVRAREGGVVLDYAELEHGPADGDPEDLHRHAAITAVRVWSPHRGVPVADVDQAAVPGKQIGVDEFYGPLFDRKRRRLMLPGSSSVRGYWQDRRAEGRRPSGPRGGGPYSFAGDENPEHAVFIPYEGWVWGYAQAFVSPPYWLRLPPREAQEIFLGLDDEVLGRPGEDIEAFCWESHWDPDSGAVWAPYFEWNWWGRCVWTVRITRDRILAIGASASD